MLQQAIEMDTLRLAAGPIITVPARHLTLHIAILAAPVISLTVAGIGAGLGVLRSDAPYTIPPVVLEWMGIFISLVWVLAVASLLSQFTTVYRLREEWVAAAILAQNPPVRTPRMSAWLRATVQVQEKLNTTRCRSARRRVAFDSVPLSPPNVMVRQE